MKTGIELIAEERATHAGRGYGYHHDEEHEDGSLADTAAIYACTHRNDLDLHTGNYLSDLIWGSYVTGIREGLPNWITKQPDRVTELIKAGALIAAEIDRLNNLKQLTNE